MTISFYSISSFANFITAGFLFWLFLIKKSRYRQFAYYNFGIAFWSFFYFLWQAFPSKEVAILSTRLLMVGATIIPLFFTNFIIEISEAGNKKYRSIQIFNLVCVLIFVPLQFTNLIVKNLEPMLTFPFWPKAGGLFFPFLMYFMLNVILAHIVMLLTYLQTRQIKYLYIFLATLIAFAGGCTNYFLWIDILIPPIGNWTVAFYVLIISYAITKHHLMDISVVIKKATSYTITAILVSATLLIGWYSTTLNTSLTLPVILALGLFWSFAAIPLKDFLTTTARRVFVKGWYDPQKAILSISAELGTTIERQNIFFKLAEKLDEILELSGVIVVTAAITDGKTNYLFWQTTTGSNKDLTFEAFTPPKADWLDIFEKDSSPITLENLSPNQKQLISDGLSTNYSKKSTVLPIIASGKTLEGLLILGPKDSGTAYTPSDIEFLKATQNFAEIVFDKIRPYEKIKADYDIAHQYIDKVAQQAGFMNLTMGIAHEINNPIFSIKNSAELLETHYTNDSKRPRLISIIRNGAHRLGKISELMLRAGNEVKGEFRSIKIAKIVDEVHFLADQKFSQWTQGGSYKLV